MAANNLTGDACGAQNPLMRLVDHMTQDQAFRQEGIGQGMSSAAMHQAPTTIEMKELLQNIEGLQVQQPQQKLPAMNGAVPWRSEFQPINSDNHELSLHSQQWQSNEQPPHFMQMNSFLFQHRPLGPDSSVQVGGESWASNYLSQVDDILLDSTKMETITERNTDDEGLKAAAKDFVRDIKDDDLQQTAFMDYVRDLAGSVDDNYSDLQELDEGLRESRSRTYDYEDEVAFWQGLEQTYHKHFLSESGNVSSDLGLKAADKYQFADKNEHLSDEDPFSKGESLLRQGNIPEAVLCFEAAVKKEPERAEAWERLGLVLAENEQEMDAIIACQACLDLQPKNGGALLSLARSYTNEMLNRDACLTLRNWLRTQEKYSHLFPSQADDQFKNDDDFYTSEFGTFERMRSFVGKEEYDNTEEMLLKAVRLNPSETDADLQIALGILYNVSGDFDKAVNSFEAALKVRSGDPLLWNKLGATLANSRQSQLAVNAYQRALELAPGFVRARSNLSIAFIELGSYWEAIEQGLIAVNLQMKSSTKEGSPVVSSIPGEGIWSLMRMAVMRMDTDARSPNINISGQGAAASLSRQELLNLITDRNIDRLNEIFESLS